MRLTPFRLTPFRLTIERLRTLVLVTAGLLIVALIASLAVKRWKSKFNISEIPKRLGVDIQQEANGVTYTQARGGHTLFKIHASKVVQLKEGGKALLHDVIIELYGEDGSRVDRIAGGEFEYDQKAGVATAAGPVEITIMKPGMAPAVAPRANADSAGKGTALSNAAQTAAAGQIEVKTSGLTFDQKSGTATTDQPVQFELAQGNGNAVGALFDSNSGHVVLDHNVEMTVRRNTASGDQDVKIHARHAEFERGSLIGTMANAEADYRGGHATAGDAKMLFRQDGSAVRLDAHDGFAMTSASGTHVGAPQGWLEFDEKNHPRHGHLEGGVTLDSVTGGRQSHGSAPVAELEFSELGDLRHAHMEHGVTMHSEEDAAGAHISRDWRSPVADMAFRAGAKGKTELASVFGQGGVIMTGQTRRGDGGMTPSKMSADQVTALFASGSGQAQQLKHITGVGHASVEQTTATGTAQTTTGDKLEAEFTQGVKPAVQAPGAGLANGQIESATMDGHVTLTQQEAAKPGEQQQPALRATGAHAVFDGGWLHLTGNPRVVNGGLEMTADKLDIAQAVANTAGASGKTQQAGNAGGDAFAHGNVKATWLNDGRNTNVPGNASKGTAGGTGGGSVGLGGQTPAHVIAAEAEFHQATGEATFKGQARLWQDANSVAAPVMVLDRNKRTLTAHGAGAGDPVKLVMLSAGGATGAGSGAKGDSGTQASDGKQSAPSVIRVRGGDLLYSDTTRKAVLHAAPGGTVMAETGTAVSNSDVVELTLLQAGTGAGKDASGAAKGSTSQVDKMTAKGNVVLTSQGRQGTGEQLVYTGQTGQYVLTGTAAKPPKLSDPAQGVVTGNALIFNSRDDSVSIEGAGNKTATTTHTPAKTK